jgi:hypothetical protein
MNAEEVLLYVSITTMIIGCYGLTIRYLFKCKITSVDCCGLSVNRNIQVEEHLEERQPRIESGDPTLSNIFSGNPNNA